MEDTLHVCLDMPGEALSCMEKTVLQGLLYKVEGEKDVHDRVCGFPYSKYIGVVSIESDKAQNSWS